MQDNERDEIDSATPKTSRTQRQTSLYMNQNHAKGPIFREDTQESAVQQRKRTAKDVIIRNGRKGKREDSAENRRFSRRPSPYRLTRHYKRCSRRPYISPVRPKTVMKVFRISIIVEDSVDGNAKVRIRPMIVETVRLTMTVQEE